MTHNDAILTAAAERYALAEMDLSEQELYEEHFFDCPRCADEALSADALRRGIAALRV